MIPYLQFVHQLYDSMLKGHYEHKLHANVICFP